jgi:hypothetical protein
MKRRKSVKAMFNTRRSCITLCKISNLIVLIIISNTCRKIEELLKNEEKKNIKKTSITQKIAIIDVHRG